MSFLSDLYFFQGQKYTSFDKNILLRQSTSLGHSSTGHPDLYSSFGWWFFQLSTNRKWNGLLEPCLLLAPLSLHRASGAVLNGC